MIKKGRKPQEQPVHTGPSVSELLRTTRQRTGLDLQTVAQVLRIRFVYLEAIEEGRYSDLPGRTYVVGFVRAYSEHLGLDSDEVVKRFKEEVSGIEGKAELVFPSPVTEQSVPGGAIILIGLIILGAAYGGWYFLSSQDRSMAELVPDLPAKFAEMVDRVKDKKVDVVELEPTPEPVVTPEPVSEADTQDMAQVARKAVEQAEEKTEETVQTVETIKVESVAPAVEKTEEVVEETSSQVEETPPAIKEKKEEVVEKVEDVVEVVAEKVEEVTEEAVQEVAEEVVAAVTPTVEAEAEPEAEPEPVKPQPMTEKIVLKAIDFSWVQLTDGEGNVIHTQVLNENEQYEIPPIHGLILRTGNAGGLEIFVDGEKMPSIGEAGEVRRKVLLNPEKLKSGSAVES